MNARKIAEGIMSSREQAVDIDDAVSVALLSSVAARLGVGPADLFVQQGPGERLRLSVPVSVPIRDRKMGEKA